MLLKRASQQGEIELPPELAKLKSELDFWNLFRVSCHARWGLSGRRLFSRTYLHFFCSNFVGLFDAEGQSHNTVYSSSFHAWYLLYDCEPIRGSGFCQIPGTRDCGHKQFAQKETGYYYASLAKRLTKQGLFLMHQSTPAAPSPPPPGLLRGICKFCATRGSEHLPTPGPFPSF